MQPSVACMIRSEILEVIERAPAFNNLMPAHQHAPSACLMPGNASPLARPRTVASAVQ
jgi:hypothetical protein